MPTAPIPPIAALKSSSVGLTFVNFAFAVNYFQTRDHFADKTPFSARAVNIGRKNSADALRVVRRKCFERQTFFEQNLDHISDARSAFDGDLFFFQIFPDQTAVFIERNERSIRHDSRIKRMPPNRKDEFCRNF